MTHTNIPPEVQEILRRSTIKGTHVTLPPGRIPRPLYEAVNKVLTNAGGKWTRSAQAHVFPSDPSAALGLALESGKTINKQQLNQSFYTPPDLAIAVVQHALVQGCSVLEPSAGHGALALACRNAGAVSVTCIEQDREACEVLMRHKLAVNEYDFLTVEPHPHNKFDRVVMNPPFTKNQDVKHVAHALQFLNQDGRLVAIMSPNTARKPFQQLVAGRDHQVIPLPAGSFKSSGTNVNTILLIINN